MHSVAGTARRGGAGAAEQRLQRAETHRADAFSVCARVQAVNGEGKHPSPQTRLLFVYANIFKRTNMRLHSHFEGRREQSE